MANNTNKSGFEHPLLQQYRAIQINVDRLRASNNAREKILTEEKVIQNQGLEQVDGPQALERNIVRSLPDYLVPGNLGDINRVIWPFWFTATAPELPAAVGGTQVQALSMFTVTQEAAFILMSITKSVFIKTLQPTVYTAVDPDVSGANGETPGLSVVMTDAQSRRFFMGNPLQFDHLGYAKFPTELPPMMFLPNSTIEMQLFNTNAVNTYVPWLTFFGYRCRIEDAEMLLSLVTG